MSVADIDWTSVLLYGIPSYIAAIGAAVAAIIAARNQRSLTTSNGRTVGAYVEDTHAIATQGVEAIQTLSEHTNGNPEPETA